MKSFHLIIFSALLPWGVVTAAPPVVLDTRIHHFDDRRVIVEQASHVSLPDPPKPEVRPVPPPMTAGELAKAAAEWRAERQSHPVINAGATVYRLPDGKTITHVKDWQVNSEAPVSFWSSADFSILAHQGGFSNGKNVNYSLLLFWSHDYKKHN